MVGTRHFSSALRRVCAVGCFAGVCGFPFAGHGPHQTPHALVAGEARAHTAPELSPGEDLFQPHTAWTVVSEGHASLAGLATNAAGHLFFNDPAEGKTYKLAPHPTSGAEPFIEESGHATGQAFGPDGRLYAAAAGERKIVAYPHADAMQVLAEDLSGTDLIVAHDGGIYVTASAQDASDSGSVWFVAPGREPQRVDSGLGSCGGIALSPDQRTLYAADPRAGVLYSYSIAEKKFPAPRRLFHRFAQSGSTNDRTPSGIAVSRQGMLFLATSTGIRVCDASGRLRCVLPGPGGPVTHLAFGGPQRDVLYVACGGKIYERGVLEQGARPFDRPTEFRAAGR